VYNNYMKVLEKAKNIVSRRIAGELFLVPIAGDLADMERIFSLTAVAEFIWERIDGQRGLNDICDDIVKHFEIGKEQAEADAREFITELLTERLIQEVVG